MPTRGGLNNEFSHFPRWPPGPSCDTGNILDILGGDGLEGGLKMDATEVIHENDQPVDLDDLNRQILRKVGKRILPASITDILRPFRDQRVYSSLYDRIRDM